MDTRGLWAVCVIACLSSTVHAQQTVESVIREFDSGDQTKREEMGKLVVATTSGIIVANGYMIVARKQPSLFCPVRPPDNLGTETIIPILRKVATEPDMANQELAFGILVALIRNYPCPGNSN